MQDEVAILLFEEHLALSSRREHRAAHPLQTKDWIRAACSPLKRGCKLIRFPKTVPRTSLAGRIGACGWFGLGLLCSLEFQPETLSCFSDTLDRFVFNFLPRGWSNKVVPRVEFYVL